jgi:hypothetical protein
VIRRTPTVSLNGIPSGPQPFDVLESIDIELKTRKPSADKPILSTAGLA